MMQNATITAFIVSELLREKQQGGIKLPSPHTPRLGLSSIRTSPPDVFSKKGALKIFAKFIGKHMCRSLIFNKVAGWRSATLLKMGVFLWILLSLDSTFKEL